MLSSNTVTCCIYAGTKHARCLFLLISPPFPPNPHKKNTQKTHMHKQQPVSSLLLLVIIIINSDILLDFFDFVGYPYDRNPRSHAYIPSGVGKFIQTHTGGRGKVTKYLTSTFWYIQSAFWGGKSKFVLNLLDDMSSRVAADIAANQYSMTVQDERYLNHYVWREYSNPAFQIRILSHSYLYPYRDEGFGDWVTKKQRPIIYHGT